MKLKKLVPAALSLALVLSLAACGSPSEPSGSTPPDTNPPATGSAVPGTEAPAADDSLQKVLDAGKLTIAAEGNWVPYVYNEDGTGELTGFEVDIAKEICSRLGVEPDFQISSSWDPVEAGMDSGRYDCIICGVNPKPERQEKYNMSIAYAENPFCLVVADDNEEITSFAAALLNAGRAARPLDRYTKKDIGRIREPLNIQVCVSLGCHHCAQLVLHTQRIAWENPMVTSHMIDANLYPSLVERYQIQRVPMTVLNGETVISGGKTMMELTTLLAKL